MAIQKFDLGSLKSKFAVGKVTTSLGHASRAGGESVAKMAQLDIMGNVLEGVSDQVARLDFDKGFAKHRAAYVQGLGFCVVIPNEPTDKTTTVTMPLPMKKIEKFTTPIEKFPTAIMNKGNKNEYPDFEFIKHDEAGNVVSKAVETNGIWSLAKFNMPVYKQRVNGYAEPISKLTHTGVDRLGVLEDADGAYLEVTSENAYCALSSITIVPGYTVSPSGAKVQGTDGLYLINGAAEDKAFQKVTAAASAAKFSIKSLSKLLAHPTYGIATNSDFVQGGYIKTGSAKIDTKPCSIHVYNSDNEVDKEFSKVISDRPAFRLNAFRAKGVRASSLEAVVVTESANTKKEVANKVLQVADNDIF